MMTMGARKTTTGISIVDDSMAMPGVAMTAGVLLQQCDKQVHRGPLESGALW